MKNLLITILVALTATANAAVPTGKQIDQINDTGGSVLTVPSVGANLVSDTATQTLSNKTLTAPVLSGTVTGTYTLGGTPTIAGSAVSGNITGNAANISATTNSTLTTLSSLSLPGSQVSGAISGNAANITATSNSTLTTLSSLSLPGAQVTGNISGNAAGLSSVLAIASGGTNNGSLAVTAGGVLYTDGSKVVNVGSGTSGQVLQSNGASAPSWVSASGGAPNVSGTNASPTAITAGGGITVSGLSSTVSNLAFVSGSGGAVTVTATPSVAGCSSGAVTGTQVTIYGGANAVTLQAVGNLAGSNLQINGNWTGSTGQSITLQCLSPTGPWGEVARSN